MEKLQEIQNRGIELSIIHPFIPLLTKHGELLLYTVTAKDPNILRTVQSQDSENVIINKVIIFKKLRYKKVE